MTLKKGKVYLVGAGPGDPGLITTKGLQCLQQAEVIVYDYLAAPALLKLANPEAEMIFVGKKEGHHTLPQDRINDLILKKAREDKIVIRLKGGDPFIFGRGGEEAEALTAAGVPFEIVPGVTSAIAAPAYAGIPLTHRAYAATVTFVTGHEDPNKPESNIDWGLLARGVGTLVFLMGVKNLPKITKRLMEKGRPPSTPAALVRWGTTSSQQTVTGTLDNITEVAKEAGIKAPAIIVIGDVVELRETLIWFERRPLLGRRILVTRARDQASDLVNRLTDLGAECLEFPTIRVAAPESWQALDNAISHLDRYDWLVFTSVNGVRFFFERLEAAGKDSRALGHLRTAVIGPATRDRLKAFGIAGDIVPRSFRAESVVEAFGSESMAGSKVLLPRAEEARPILPEELRKMGAEVDDVTAYVTYPVTDEKTQLLETLESGQIDLITFTSSSTVRNFKSLLPQQRTDQLMEGIVVASIGPITSQTATELDFNVDIEAEAYTIPGLCEAIQRYFELAQQ